MTDTSPASNARNYPLLAVPHVQLHGPVDDAMYDSFKAQVAAAPTEGPLVVSITTLGGDPEMARAMGDHIRLLREYTDRETLFLGKVAVYSAGATFMSAFPADSRFLTRNSRLMIHERQMTSTIQLNGPLNALSYTLKAKLHEIEDSINIQEEGFRDLVRGTKVDIEELKAKAPSNWYIEAEEARDLGLILDII
ncbi:MULTISPECIES: ClpP family protease [Sphingomonas]|jgi:ATP-dependent Clp protease protease subunit|uniref:ATP-dependent protease ClpP protease subunit n=2 Tax=Sphingomonas TaxID=13687 RepID=A0A2T4YQG2_9SPHN|nr:MULTISPECIES: ATP-dependent Clp protease proteolytic subunit [Sphingomonas]RZL77455.1 MAG: peptidase S14 [Sphingomonas sp.]KQN14337.1 peptidase S14 [Sphingomonas sp. Leaf30]MBB3585400.1 ATP-dependent protease ClpP protease subunit [Sphingomonas sp. BK481]MBD8469128.1 ATP-dependent Clp protease proteolytic subunit [Sphingomonas sp. CFBP 8765]MBD8552591.1 ATP-dependent Clp protease proteolytic subunit [Sphingomonas sp. CFBP 8764]